MVRVILVIIIYLTTWALDAQEKETEFKRKATEGLRTEFPSFRPFNFEFGNSFARDFDSQLLGEDFQNGRIEGQRTFKAAINMPFLKTKKWVMTGSFDYLYNEFHFKGLENLSPTNTYVQDETVDFHNFRTAISSTYFSMIFKKPVIYNASLILDGNNNGFERFKGLIGASLVMKRTERTTITLGAVVFIDPTAQIPFFPTFTYNHKFKGSLWELDFILPQRLLVRRPISQKGRLSIGSTLGGNGFYVNVNSPMLPDVFEYSQLEINTGLIYEHKLSESVIATVKGGMSNFISSRLTEKGRSNSDYIYANDQGATGYFNLGFSYNPFAGLEKN
tara:strand:+ start:9072 stop:10070 length:999 start_codon:yes stop_codon:yes gene_type:complete